MRRSKALAGARTARGGGWRASLMLAAVALGVVGRRAAAGALTVSLSNASPSLARYDSQAGFSMGTAVPNGAGGFQIAEHLLCGADGNLYVADYSRHAIERYNAQTGAFID